MKTIKLTRVLAFGHLHYVCSDCVKLLQDTHRVRVDSKYTSEATHCPFCERDVDQFHADHSSDIPDDLHKRDIEAREKMLDEQCDRLRRW
jgi:DNA-directed RNA polymerase subunit RPC12/RpoP